MGRASQFLAVSLFLSFALASHVRAWHFDFGGFIQKGPFAFLRSSRREKPFVPRTSYYTPPPQKNEYYDGNLQLSPQPCILDDLQTIAACACFVARELTYYFPVRERDLCIDVLKLSFEEMERRCDVFRDYNGKIQRFRLTHIVFNTITVCPVERVKKETAEARRRTQKPSPSQSAPFHTTTKEPPTSSPYRKPPTTKPYSTYTTPMLPSSSRAPDSYPYYGYSSRDTFSQSPTPLPSQTSPILPPTKAPYEISKPMERPSNRSNPLEPFSSSKSSVSSLYPHQYESSNPYDWGPVTEKRTEKIEATVTKKTTGGFAISKGSHGWNDVQFLNRGTIDPDCSDEECDDYGKVITETAGRLSQKMLSGLEVLMEGLSGAREGTLEQMEKERPLFTSSVPVEVPYPAARQFQVLPNSRSSIFGVLEVLRRIGSIVSGILRPNPSQFKAQYLASRYFIQCRRGIRPAGRVLVTRKKLTLMINNEMEVEAPLLEEEEESSNLKNTDRQTRRVGVVGCRIIGRRQGRLNFSCECRARRRRRRRNRR